MTKEKKGTPTGIFVSGGGQVNVRGNRVFGFERGYVLELAPHTTLNVDGNLAVRSAQDFMKALGIADSAEERRELLGLLVALQYTHESDRPAVAQKTAAARGWISTGADISQIIDLATKIDVVQIVRLLFP